MRPSIPVAVFCGVIFAGAPTLAGPKDEMPADKAFSDLPPAEGAHAAFLATMADDALIYEGSRPPIIGKAAAAAFYAQEEPAEPGYTMQKLSWSPTGADASADGTLGYPHGTWTLTAPKKDGSPFKLEGYYVTEWRRQANREYKFAVDIGGAYGP